MNLEEAKTTDVFEIENGNILEINLYEKMSRSLDETTTPRGVGGRLFIEEHEFELDPDDFENGEIDEDEFIKSIGMTKSSKEDFEFCKHSGKYILKYFVISSWGFTGNKYQSGEGSFDREFLTKEEADEKMFEYLKVDFDGDWDNSCNCYYTREEAVEALAEQMNISTDVCEHILRKKEALLNIKEKRKEEANNLYKKQKLEREIKWKERFGIRKEGDSHEVASAWLEQNKEEVIKFIEKGGNELGKMSSKVSKKVSWAICKDSRFDTEGIDSVSLSHLIR
jgi:hypothetical protein